MKKTIILDNDMLDMLTSGGEVTFGDDNNEIHLTTQAALNRRTTIAELRDILIHSGAVSITQGVKEINLLGIPGTGYHCHDSEATVTIDYNKLAEVAYDHLMGG